ncbi:Uncharacterised protein [Klebsiella pneumoniae]|nr:Uncharacterised protein [Klebsiella pneumoniae]
MQTEQPQAYHRDRQALPPGARRAHLHHHPCGQRDEHHRQAHDKRPFAERRRRGDRIDPQAEVERKPESADDEFWPVLLLRAKTAAERQQKQRGEEKTQPKKREHRHAGDRLAGKYPAAGGNHRRGNQQQVSLPLAYHTRLSLCVGLPARHRAAVEDSLCRLRHLRRLVRLHKLLHVLRVFIVFPGHDDVHVGRVFIFDKDAVTNRRQPGLLQVGGADDSHVDFGIVEYARQLRPFQLHDLQVMRVVGDIHRRRQQAGPGFEGNQLLFLQQQ